MSFNLEPFWEVGLATQIHTVFAWIALLTGCYIFLRRKGSPAHKAAGKAWVFMMGVVAVSSFFIHGLKTWGLFSPLHLLSLFTLASLTFSIWAIRRGDIRAHKFSMIGLFLGGLVVTGALTFSRELLMHEIFLSGESWAFLPSPSEWPGGVFGMVFSLFALVFGGTLIFSYVQERRDLN